MYFDNRIKEEIFSIVKGIVDESEYINLEGKFEDIGIGSISFIKIMVKIEVHYNIEIEEKYFINTEYINIRSFIDKMATCVSICMNRLH